MNSLVKARCTGNKSKCEWCHFSVAITMYNILYIDFTQGKWFHLTFCCAQDVSVSFDSNLKLNPVLCF